MHPKFETVITHVWITKYVLRCIQNLALSDFSICLCLVNLFMDMDIIAKGFGKPHTNFGVFFIDAWGITVSNLCYIFFFCYTNVGVCSF